MSGRWGISKIASLMLFPLLQNRMSSMGNRLVSNATNKAKRILIVLGVIAIAMLTVTAVTQMVSGDAELSKGVIFTVVGIAVLSWVIATLSKRRISFTRLYLALLFSGLFVLVSSAYLDVNSLSDIKDSFNRALTTEKGEFRGRVDLVVQRTELKFIEVSEAIKKEQEEESIASVGDHPTGDEAGEKPTQSEGTTKPVSVGRAILVGGDGHIITLRNNPNAANPSWADLKSFLLGDDTDRLRYDFTTFVCADFAEKVHNNAEEAGIKAALVTIRLGPCSYYPIGGGHALNAFETTDRGLVFIDCTSSNQGMNADKTVIVEVGKDYVPRSIFPEPGWYDVWANMGKVLEIETVQW